MSELSDAVESAILANIGKAKKLKAGDKEIEQQPLADLVAAKTEAAKSNPAASANPFACLRITGLNFPGCGG